VVTGQGGQIEFLDQVGDGVAREDLKHASFEASHYIFLGDEVVSGQAVDASVAGRP
jgi:hypothetical protein